MNRRLVLQQRRVEENPDALKEKESATETAEKKASAPKKKGG